MLAQIIYITKSAPDVYLPKKLQEGPIAISHILLTAMFTEPLYYIC